MNCSSSANITPAAFPVGSPLISGNPNKWNVGAGNFYSHNENVVPVPANTSNQIGGKKSKTRKHKISATTLSVNTRKLIKTCTRVNIRKHIRKATKSMHVNTKRHTRKAIKSMRVSTRNEPDVIV